MRLCSLILSALNISFSSVLCRRVVKPYLLWCAKKYSETYGVGEVEIDFVSDSGL
jgi:hypothetical protein